MNRFFTLIACLLTFLGTYSQDAFTINANSSWKTDKLINVWSKRGQRSNGDESYRLFVNGDTVINNQSFLKLYKTGILYLDTPEEFNHIYVGAARQKNQKVYFVAPNTESEELLYDFSLQVNDTIVSKIGNGRKITQIDILPDGRKRFLISKSMLHGMDAYIIEGIGSTGGFLNEPPVGHYAYTDAYLICYSENKNLIYSGIDPLSSGCFSEPSRYPIDFDVHWKIQKVPTSRNNESDHTGEDYYTYYIDGDTVVNNNLYLKIYKDGIAYYDEPFPYEHVYYGALRDDGNKFYFIDKSEQEEKLILDYNLNVGDIIEAEIGKNLTVTSVSRRPDGRKIIKAAPEVVTGCAPIPELIEGVGHTGGISETPPCNHPGYMINQLRCFLLHDSIVYSNPLAGDSACVSSPVVVKKLSDEEIKIWPNPAKQNLNISLKRNTDLLYIKIFDLEGKTRIFTNIAKTQQNIELDVQQLSKGMYFIYFQNAGNTFKYHKFIKE